MARTRRLGAAERDMVADLRGALTPPGSGRRGGGGRGRRIAVWLATAAACLALIGAFLFARFGRQLAREPGLTSRNARVLGKVLEQGRLAEARGDRVGAAAAYRFVVRVGAQGDSTLRPYAEAAAAGLTRLGATAGP